MKTGRLLTILLILTGTCKLYAQAPKIISFNPAVGVAGTSVTISGSGFSNVPDSNVVYFGATRAKINSADDSQLQVTVPAGATYSQLTVINKTTRLSAASALSFSPVLALADATGLDPKVRLHKSAQAADVKIMDIDGDGKPDIITTNPVTHSLMVFLNKATKGQLDTGSFAAPVIYPAGQQPGIVSICDMDGDGRADIVLMNAGYSTAANGNNSLTIFQNLSTPGKIKLSVVTIVDSTATAPAQYAFHLTPGDNVARIADFDSDGKPDIAVLNTAGFITIYKNSYIPGLPLKNLIGSADTVVAGLHPQTFNTGDVNNDGKPDIMVADPQDNLVRILQNTSAAGNILFQRSDLPITYEPLSISVTDIDGDGKPDAIISTPAGSPTVLLHNTSPAGPFAATNIDITNLYISSNYNDNILLQDINGDGKPDLISLNPKLDSVFSFSNKSTPGLATTAYFNGKNSCPVITVPDCTGDLDGDGKPDMVVGSAFGIDIFHNNTALAPPPPPVTQTNTVEMTIYPNPATSITNVKYYLPVNSAVQISVFDMAGRLWSTTKTSRQSAGENISTLQTSSLSKGTYVVEVMAAGYKKAAKLIVP